MPPINTVTTPTGARVRADAADKLARCQELRAEALNVPIGAEWDEQDRATYLRHLDETEAKLKGQVAA